MNRFSLRKYISIGLALTFLLVMVTGIVLYIAPPGSIARWQEWRLLWLERAEWEAQHTVFSYTLLVFAVIHLFTLNWKLFVSYLVNGINERLRGRRELIIAFTTVIVLFLLTHLRVPPVISVMDLGDSVSAGWELRRGGPPEPGLEKLSLEAVALEYLEIDPGVLVEMVAEAGLICSGPGEILIDVAEVNDLTPNEFYKLLTGLVSDSKGGPSTGQ